MIHEAESCTIVYYRRERTGGRERIGGRQRPSLKPTLPLFHPSILLSPRDPSRSSLSGVADTECRGLSRALSFNVSTESEPMTGRNRGCGNDASFLAPRRMSPPPRPFPSSRYYRADPGHYVRFRPRGFSRLSRFLVLSPSSSITTILGRR